MNSLFGVDAGELPGWISGWTKRLLKSDNPDNLVPEFLAEVGEFVSAERSFFFQSKSNSGKFDLISEWCAPEVEAIGNHVSPLNRDDLPVLEERILASKAVVLSRLDDLPEHAEKERALLSRLDIEAVLALPVSAGDTVVGFIAIQSDLSGSAWPPEVITFLSAAAGILATALEQHEISLWEGQLHGFVEAAVDYVGIADPESHEIVYLNAAGRELIGLGKDDSLEGVTVESITPESQMQAKRETIYPTVQKEGSWHGEMMIRKLDGTEEIPVYQTLIKVPYPDAPSRYALGTIIHDLRIRKAAEEKLIASEKFLRDLVTTAPHALYLLNYEKGQIEIGEENFARMTGYSIEELRAFPDGVYGPIHPDDIPAIEAQEKLLAEADDDKVVPATFRFCRKDGHWDWIEVHSKVFERDENGKPIREVGMAQIITGRKLAEERLRRTDERIEMAVRATRVGLWDSDLLTGHDWWSSRIYETLGYEPGEIEPKYENFVDLLHPDDRQRVRDHLDAHLEHGNTYDIEYRMRMKSGEYRWFRGRGEAIRDENSRPVRMAGSTERIDRRKRAELKLAREAEINRVILHVMSGFAFVLDPEGKTLQSNPAATELTEISEDEFRQKPLWELLFPAGSRQRAEMLDEIEKIKGGARFFHSMRKIWKKGGSTGTVEYACSGIYSETGELLNIVFVGFDLSEHQRLHREVIRMVEQEQIRIGADLHDGVGQLLTGVSDLSEALTGRIREPGNRAAAAKVHFLVRNAISEIRRMSQGLTPTSIENHGLAGSLRILAESVEEQSRIRCSVRVDQLDEARDLEMLTHLFRIAQEAVNNAVKHSQGTAIAITLKETESETILRIEDNGIGIQSRNRSGNRGVGLTVMDYRVGLMGGTLNIGNRPGGGTRVECRLQVDFDRLDKLSTGTVFLYKPKLKEIDQTGPVEPAVRILDS